MSPSGQPVKPPKVEVPATDGQASAPSSNPSPSSSRSSSKSRQPSPSRSLVELDTQVGRGGLYPVCWHASSASRTPSLSSSSSSRESRQPSLSQSVELAGSSQSCMEVQLYWLLRGQRSGKLSVRPSLSSSESQASPSLSKSVLPWPGLLTVGQLSRTSGTPSASVSISVAGSKPKAIASMAPVGEMEFPPWVMLPPNPPTMIASSLMFTVRSNA